MKILVTGATGFLGSYTAERLQKEGHEVYGCGRSLSEGKKLEAKGIHFLQGDLADEMFTWALPDDVEAVVHCAALSSPWGKRGDFWRCNVTATRHLLQRYQETGLKRFVHISSPSIYVDTKDRFNIREDDPLPEEELNLYITTKKIAEQEVDRAFELGLPVITLRPQGIVGPGDRAIFPRIIKRARQGMVPKIGEGKTVIDITHVDNVVEAIVCALKANDQALGCKYNVTNGEPIDLYETISWLMDELKIKFRYKNLSFRKAMGIAKVLEWTCQNVLTRVEPPLTRYSVCVLGVSRTLNIEAAKRDLGYRPVVNMNEAKKRIAEHYREFSIS